MIALAGFGNEDRGDDAAGLLVIRRLRGRTPTDVLVHELNRDGFTLLDLWRTCDRAVVVDAVVSGAEPGAVHQLDAAGLLERERFSIPSTHGLGLKETVRLAEALGCLPKQLTIVGIEARQFEPGTKPGEQVMEGIERATELVARMLQAEPAAYGMM